MTFVLLVVEGVARVRRVEALALYLVFWMSDDQKNPHSKSLLRAEDALLVAATTWRPTERKR